MYRLQHVSFAYPHSPYPSLVEINLEISPGERLAIIGPSGCGKTTLLLLLAGLLQPTEGKIWLETSLLQKPRPDIALLLQDYGLFPWKTVYENAALGLVLKGLPAEKIREKVLPLLTFLGLQPHLRKLPAQLSGGQRQRVALARCLAVQPNYLLLDEPFSALDALTREQLQDNLLSLAELHPFTLIIVTHNIEEAVYLGQRIIVLSPAPGRIRHILDNTALSRPERNSPLFYQTCSKVRALLEEKTA